MDFFFFQAEDGIRDIGVTGVQTCALPISGACVDLASPASSAGTSGFHRARSSATRVRAASPTARSSSPETARRLPSTGGGRTEERRVGEECRARWSPYVSKKKTTIYIQAH